MRSADAFPVVASLPPKNSVLFFGEREATTGNASALRRLSGGGCMLVALFLLRRLPPEF